MAWFMKFGIGEGNLGHIILLLIQAINSELHGKAANYAWIA
jgi:hypothetical protein